MNKTPAHVWKLTNNKCNREIDLCEIALQIFDHTIV